MFSAASVEGSENLLLVQRERGITMDGVKQGNLVRSLAVRNRARTAQAAQTVGCVWLWMVLLEEETSMEQITRLHGSSVTPELCLGDHLGFLRGFTAQPLDISSGAPRARVALLWSYIPGTAPTAPAGLGLPSELSQQCPCVPACPAVLVRAVQVRDAAEWGLMDGQEASKAALFLSSAAPTV